MCAASLTTVIWNILTWKDCLPLICNSHLPGNLQVPISCCQRGQRSRGRNLWLGCCWSQSWEEGGPAHRPPAATSWTSLWELLSQKYLAASGAFMGVRPVIIPLLIATTSCWGWWIFLLPSCCNKVGRGRRDWLPGQPRERLAGLRREPR